MQRRILRTMVVFWLAAMGISLAANGMPGAELGSDSAAPLVQGFRQPPDQTKPWVYWYWITDNISGEGITRDLEAMARVGIGEAFIGNIFLEDVQRGSVKALSEPWWGLVEHAIREGGRLGVNIGMFNCPGWSQSGGPWIKPDQAMRYMVSTERRVTGPARFEERLVPPAEPFQDIAVLAFPAPHGDADTVAARSPRVTCTPVVESSSALCDGDLKTVCLFPPGAGQGRHALAIEIESAEPFTARSLVLHPAQVAFAAQCELQAADEAGVFHPVHAFPLDRSNVKIHVGPMPHGPVAVSFPAVTSQRFRLMLTNVRGPGGLAEIELSGAARLERFVEKQLGKMHPTPLPMWDTYLWPPQDEPDAPQLTVPAERVVDLRDQLAADGTLRWDVPAGQWIILRTGMTPTGIKNAPASPEGEGLEVDKMNRQAAQSHFDAFIGHLLGRMPAAERTAFKHVVADSYEMGPQNWTDGFGELFLERYGYDARRWLPVLTGRLVGSADQSNRFLWDLRRLVADRVAVDYVGGLRDACHEHGLKLWLENYGHWGFPAEFLQYGGQADQIGGEFWATGDLGSIELRAGSSAAHTYGMPVISAEAFTGGPFFVGTPWALKRRGDWAVTEGINHFVLHVYIHQPWEDRRPGVNAWFGTEFNRHNTWFNSCGTWIEYLRRSHFLLQQGRHVADVAYFIGEDTPKMTGVRQPELPAGYDFDYINAEVIQQRLEVADGRFVLPGGSSYRLLVLPELDTMRPELLHKIRDLVAAGGAVLGPPPVRSPSLEGYPACDEQVRNLAAEVWAGCDGQTVKHVRFGQGHVFRNMDLAAVLAELKTPPDVRGVDPKKLLWTHRRDGDADIYLLSSQSERPESIAPVFRVVGKAPELWHADSGRIERAAAFEAVDGGVRVPVDLEARGSAFVVFRHAAGAAPSVTEVMHDGQVVVSTAVQDIESSSGAESQDAANTFTITGWLKPSVDIALPEQADRGAVLQLARNDAIFPAHGASLFGDDRHACAGLSAGRNGVVVYEHSSSYFAPLLVHAAPLADWTHVAVVYQDGRPSLYLNGKLVHQGLQSRYTVHPSPGGGQAGPGGPFQGEWGEIQQPARALTAAEIVLLAALRPPVAGDSPLAVVVMTRGAGDRLEAETSAAGSYRVVLSDGQVRTFEVPTLPPPLDVNGPWQVGFPAQMDVPQQATFERLMSWTEHPQAAVRYFSGTATYQRSFELSADRLGTDRNVLLDLGQVESLAEVLVNGRNLGVFWKPPFVVDITGLAQPGTNTLEVRVTNAWLNRLIGDKQHPQGFPDAGPLQFKPYLAADISNRLGNQPIPAGLLGPVRIRTTQRVRLP